MSVSKFSLMKQYGDLKNHAEPITSGYGEYLVYRPSGKPLPEELFNETFQSIRKHAIAHSEDTTLAITKEIKETSSDLEVAFIPRTLYELVYIHASIQEERKAPCPSQNKSLSTAVDKNACWHIFFPKETASLQPKDDSDLYHLAYRFNQYCLQQLEFQNRSFTGQEIVNLTEKHIQFLQNHAKTYREDYFKGKVSACPGVSFNFSGFDDKIFPFRCFSMAVKTQTDANLVRKAIALECHQIAQNALILYRAGSWNQDCNLQAKTMAARSLSYGTSLFAGCVRDGSACVFYYAKRKSTGNTCHLRDTYAVLLPYREYDENSPFYIPMTSALEQLLSNGEFFHARSKVAALNAIGTIYGVLPGAYDSLFFKQLVNPNTTTEELTQSLNHYHKNSSYLLLSDEF